MIGEYGKFVYLTYFGTFLALSAIYLTLQYQFTEAMMCFIGSGICDLFDGQVARSFKRTEFQKGYGVEIDSLCDMVSFAALPAILLMTLAQQAALDYIGLIVASIYVIAAVSRLAYFNTQVKSNTAMLQTHFIGVPVTYSALVFPVLYLIFQWLWPHYLVHAWLIAGGVLAFLFVWNKPIPKPNRQAYSFFVGLALLTWLGLWSL